MTMIRRLLGVLSAMVLAVFAAPMTGAPSVAASPTQVHANVYDSHVRCAALSYIITERGPPGSCEIIDAYRGVDRWSPGASARPEGATTTLAYTYDHPALLVQVASACVTSALVRRCRAN